MRTLAFIGLALTLIAAEPVPPPPPASAPAAGPPAPPPAGLKVQRAATGFQFTEGIVSDKSGHIYFTDIPANRILAYDPELNRVTTVRSSSGGANGLAFDAQQRLCICEGGNRRVTQLVGNEVHLLADRYEGKPFNSPNDLECDTQGGIYFTDPRYGPREGMELPEAVYYRDPEGKVTRLIDGLRRPNGVTISPDGRMLYVADEAAAKVYAYPIRSPGVLGDGQVFSHTDPGQAPGPDGITCDSTGNLYAAAAGGVWIWNGKGEAIGFIALPETPSNVCFSAVGDKGDPSLAVMYVTARTSLYRVTFKRWK